MKKTKKTTKKLWMIVLIIIIALWAYFAISALSTSEKEDFDGVVSTGETITNKTVEAQITLEIVWPEEEPENEEREYAPGAITNVSEKDWTTYFTLDMLTANPDFQPGVTDFFLNESPTIRDLAIAKNAKAFTCGTENIPDVSVAIETIIMNVQNTLSSGQSQTTYYFDIDDNKINTIYEQCLP